MYVAVEQQGREYGCRGSPHVMRSPGSMWVSPEQKEFPQNLTVGTSEDTDHLGEIKEAENPDLPLKGPHPDSFVHRHSP